MNPVRGFRRLLGVLLFTFMGLPLSLGGLSLLSMRGWLVDEAKYLSLVQDGRFERLITAPELAAGAPASFSLGDGLPKLSGRAAVSALQQAIPAKAVVSAGEAAVRGFFRALERGEGVVTMDFSALSAELERARPALAEAYRAQTGQELPAQAIPSLPPTLSFPLEPEGSGPGWEGRPTNLAAMRAGLNAASVWMVLAGAGLCVASAFIGEDDWRRRCAALGSRVLGPGVFISVIGLLPHLVNPAGLVGRSQLFGFSMAQFPALTEYLKFAATSLSGGFLVVGLWTVGVGTALASSKFLLPSREDETELEA